MDTEPSAVVYCLCGAQWHGRYVYSGAVNIEAHRQRGGECRIVTHAEFIANGQRCKASCCKRTLVRRDTSLVSAPPKEEG